MSVVTLHRKTFVPTITFRADDAGSAEATITTETADLDHDRVTAAGIRLERFRRNPVVLYAHDYQGLPVGTATALDVEPGRGIRARWRWLEGDEFADRVRNAWEQGVLRGTSIGFLPIRSKPNELGGVDFLETELLEFSVCPLPANSEAVRQLKALGLSPSRRSITPEMVKHAVTQAFQQGLGTRQEARRSPAGRFWYLSRAEALRWAPYLWLCAVAYHRQRDMMRRWSGWIL
jgi:HK97 family phage prohead protease